MPHLLNLLTVRYLFGISLNVPVKFLYWLSFYLLEKAIVSDTFYPLVHCYLKGGGWTKEMSRVQHSKEIMSYISN